MKRRQRTSSLVEAAISRPAGRTVPHTPNAWRTRLAGMILAAALLAPLASAEPATPPAVSAPPPAALRVVEPGAPEVEMLLVRAPAAPKQDALPARLDLEELLFIPGADRESWKPQTPDELLAVAVAEGSQPELEPRNPFRKKSRDLFSTERPLSIGNQELLMRLRLRPKAKKAVSVEFHF